MRRVCKIIEATGFDDAHSGNIINTQDGTIYFIDTEEKSFVDVKDLAQLPLDQRALILDTFNQTTEMTDAATAFLSNKIAQLNAALC